MDEVVVARVRRVVTTPRCAGRRHQSRVHRVADVEDRGAVEAGVGPEAGGVEVPLVAGGRRGERLGAGLGRVGVDLDRVLEVGQVEDREGVGAVVTGRVGVAAVGRGDAGDRVRARRPRGTPGDVGVGRVGDVHDDQLVAASGVDVLDVVG